MDIYDFDYQNKHFQNTIYKIHPLSNNGFAQYIGTESYTHKYIDPNNNKIKEPKTKENFNTYTESNLENCNKYPLEEPSDRHLSNKARIKYPSKDGKYEENEENLNVNNENEGDFMGNNMEKFNNYNYNYNKDNLNGFENNKFSKAYSENQTNSILNNLKNLKETSNTYTNNKGKSYGKNYNTYNFLKNSETNPKDKRSNFSISTEKSFNFKKANLDPLTRRLNYTSSDFFKTTSNFNGKFKNPTRYDPNYLKNVNLLVNSKSYFEMDKIKEDRKRKYDGFQSYAVPNLNGFKEDNISEKRSPLFNLTQKISKSCTGIKKNSEDNKEKENENEKISDAYEESEKLKKIMFFQTNKDFLKQNKIPEIQKFIEQPNMKIFANPTDFTRKNMGEAYNPYNFLAGRDCETRRRNVNGALFNH